MSSVFNTFQPKSKSTDLQFAFASSVLIGDAEQQGCTGNYTGQRDQARMHCGLVRSNVHVRSITSSMLDTKMHQISARGGAGGGSEPLGAAMVPFTVGLDTTCWHIVLDVRTL